MDVSIREVCSERDLNRFISLPDRLYKNCRYYVPQLHSNMVSTLSGKKNPAFNHCEAKYWLAYSGNTIVGRIAGIINHRYNQERATESLRFGWIDFIEDQKVANLLTEVVENWGREKGMKNIQGPLGFTSFDNSGILVEGFEEYPTSFGNYNYPYYDQMLKNNGYIKDVDWIEFRINFPGNYPLREKKVANLLMDRYSLRNADINSKKDIKEYSKKIFNLVNESYSELYGFTTLSPEQIDFLTDSFLPLINPDYLSVILNSNNDVIAVGLVLPSLTKALKKAGGKLFPFGILHIHHALWFNDTIDLLIIGIKKEYRSKGIYSLIFNKIFTNLKRKGIKYVETTRELETNDKVQQLWKGLDLRQHKRARCYIKPLYSTAIAQSDT